MSLTVSDDRFDAMLAGDEIELSAELSDEAIEKMRYNRDREFSFPEMELLDGEPLMEKYKTYSRSARQANRRRRKIGLGIAQAEEDPEKQDEILCLSTTKLFTLMRPLIKYTEYWDEMDLDYQEIEGDGLKQIDEYADAPEDLHPDDAYAAHQEIRTAAVAIGFLYNVAPEIQEVREEANYWVEEAEAATEHEEDN